MQLFFQGELWPEAEFQKAVVKVVGALVEERQHPSGEVQRRSNVLDVHRRGTKRLASLTYYNLRIVDAAAADGLTGCIVVQVLIQVSARAATRALRPCGVHFHLLSYMEREWNVTDCLAVYENGDAPIQHYLPPAGPDL